MGQLIEGFTLECVGKSGAVFNVEKLDWLNFEHLRRKPDAEVLTMVKEYISASPYSVQRFDDQYLLSIIAAMRERATFVKDFAEKCPYFYRAPAQYEPEVVQKRWKPESRSHLRQLQQEFSELDHPSKEDYEAALHRTAESLKINFSELIHPLRLAVSGMGAGPGLYDILMILGKDETVRRITYAIDQLP